MRRVFDVSVQPTSRDESIHPKNKSKSSFDCSSRKNQIEWREKKQHRLQASNRTRKKRSFAFAVKENYVVMWEIWNETHSRAQKSLCLGTKSTRKRTQAIVSFRVIRFEQHFFLSSLNEARETCWEAKKKTGKEWENESIGSMKSIKSPRLSCHGRFSYWYLSEKNTTRRNTTKFEVSWCLWWREKQQAQKQSLSPPHKRNRFNTQQFQAVELCRGTYSSCVSRELRWGQLTNWSWEFLSKKRNLSSEWAR